MPYEEKNSLMLEKYVLGELSDKKREEVETLLKGDVDLRERVEKIRMENEAFLNRYPVETFVADIEDALKEPMRKKTRMFGRLFPYAVPVFGILIIIFILPFTGYFSPDKITYSGPLEVTRTKGEGKSVAAENPVISVFRKTSGGTEEIKDGDYAVEGDLLQISYHAGSKTYGVIFSVDGNRVLTFHKPSGINGDKSLKRNQRVFLDNSYELDNAPVFERFFFISSDKKENIDSLLKKLEQLKNVADKIEDTDMFFEEAGCICRSVLIMKR